LDVDTLDSLKNPVNLNVHYHEELVARTQKELESYQVIMTVPLPERVEQVRGWYRECIEAQEEAAKQKGNSLCNIDLDSLCATIKSAKTVMFFGGSSLGILQRLIQRGVASNMQCFLQAVRKYLLTSREILIISQGSLRSI
jgi:hypothetical protein